MSSNRFIWNKKDGSVNGPHLYSYVHTEEFIRCSASMRYKFCATFHGFRFAQMKYVAGEKNSKFQYKTQRKVIPAALVHTPRAPCRVACDKIHYRNNMKYASRKKFWMYLKCVCESWCWAVCCCVVCVVRYVWCVAAIPSSLVAHNGPTHLPLTQRILHKRRSPNGPTSPGKRISVTSSKWMVSSSSSSSSSSDSSTSSGACGM